MGGKTLDRSYVSTCKAAERELAAADRFAIHMDRAGAALRDAATIFGSGQIKMIPQNP